ncbi:MAG: glutamine-synthetase adenylyltransferase [Maritimibacter sp.]
MSFASQITRIPLPFDPDRGAEIVALFSDLPPELREVLRGAGGSSPYLCGLMHSEADWLRAAFSRDPRTVFEGVLADMGGETDADLRRSLRQAKRRAALFTALADLAGVWSLEQVTSALTKLGETATDMALKFHVAQEIKRGKLPGANEDDIKTAGGAVALAMGKMGAYELNYSSDIDLIMLFDESRYERDDFHEARASLIRATRRMSLMLSENTAEGYVFRTDLRLRPDPSVTPVILSMEAAERYYESLGRTWERAAHIKARPCAGDIAVGEAYLTRLRPFIWRKHLDFAAIQDAHDMRLRIREHKGLGGPITLEGHNMKLGRGGIREIEFFAQTRQLIAGGRDDELRMRATVPALEALAEKGWIEPEVSAALIGHYRTHRDIEHRLQMVRDAQTHDLPKTPDGFLRLANMMGEGDAQALRTRLQSALTHVHEMSEGFFAPEGPTTEPEAQDPEKAAIFERWESYPALRSPRAGEIFQRLKPELLTRLAEAARPREAVDQFDAFLKGLPAGVQLFSLFEANPHMLDLIVDIAATAPALAVYLGRNAQVLDAVIGGDFFAPWPGAKGLEAALRNALESAQGDYEAQLDGARRWRKEWHFRIGVHHLRGLISGNEAGAQYADLADAVVRVIWDVVVAQFSTKHGSEPGRGAALIGMGSLGARAVSASSDLDVIMIYDAAGVEASEGKRPLNARTYYARLTQAFVTALTAPMPEGTLYEVDMRLRPSGRQGPVATSLDAFRSYQESEAWTWEHLALTRARAVAGNPEIGAAVAEVREMVLGPVRDQAKTINDVIEMRARIFESGKPAGPLEIKVGPGRIQDIELLAQCAALLSPTTPRATTDQIQAGVGIGWITPKEATALCRAYDLLRRLQLASKLLTDAPLDLEAIGKGGLDFLLRKTGAQSAQKLLDQVARCTQAGAQAIEAILARKPGDVT